MPAAASRALQRAQAGSDAPHPALDPLGVRLWHREQNATRCAAHIPAGVRNRMAGTECGST